MKKDELYQDVYDWLVTFNNRMSRVDFHNLSVPKYFSMVCIGEGEAQVKKMTSLYFQSLHSGTYLHESGMVYLFNEPYFRVPRKYVGRSIVKWGVDENQYDILSLSAQIMKRNAKLENTKILASFLYHDALNFYEIGGISIGDIARISVDTILEDSFVKPSEHSKFKINRKWFLKMGICVENGAVNTAKAVAYANRVLNGGKDVDSIILEKMMENSKVSLRQLSDIIGVSLTTIHKHIDKLRSEGKIRREGSVKGGYWKIIE